MKRVLLIATLAAFFVVLARTGPAWIGGGRGDAGPRATQTPNSVRTQIGGREDASPIVFDATTAGVAVLAYGDLWDLRWIGASALLLGRRGAFEYDLLSPTGDFLRTWQGSPLGTCRPPETPPAATFVVKPIPTTSSILVIDQARGSIARIDVESGIEAPLALIGRLPRIEGFELDNEPVVSPTGQYLAYLAFKGSVPVFAINDLESGEAYLIKEGDTATDSFEIRRWSEDGTIVSFLQWSNRTDTFTRSCLERETSRAFTASTSPDGSTWRTLEAQTTTSEDDRTLDRKDGGSRGTGILATSPDSRMVVEFETPPPGAQVAPQVYVRDVQAGVVYPIPWCRSRKCVTPLVSWSPDSRMAVFSYPGR